MKRSKGKVREWDEDGKPLRMIGTHEDITDRKVIEEALKKKNKQLEILKREAENANKAKSLFLANMSHEIRTPINGIMEMLQLLQLAELNQEQHKYVSMIKDSLDLLNGIINDVLDISKIETGKISLNEEPFDLKQVLNSICNNLLITGNSKGLEVSCYIDPNIAFQVCSDKLKLKQILLNLTSNAVKFTEEGYVSFRTKIISSDDKSVIIEFRVKDSGIGIEENFKQNIFQIFSQGDLSVNKKYQGTGLGLSISKQLATLLNGDIAFESKVGEGSTFIFTCEFKKYKTKLENKTEIKASKNIIPQDKQTKDKFILYVEDNIINQEGMKNIITRKGYKYLSAYNGKEALEILENNKVDFILMDIQLPELNGFETTKIIRDKYQKDKHIPIIAITAYAMREDRDKCLAEGMDDYIAKPFDLDNLYSMIEYYLQE